MNTVDQWIWGEIKDHFGFLATGAYARTDDLESDEEVLYVVVPYISNDSKWSVFTFLSLLLFYLHLFSTNLRSSLHPSVKIELLWRDPNVL